MARSDRIIKIVVEFLEGLRCLEKHHTGFGCCTCTTNDVIDDIENYLLDEGAPWNNLDENYSD